MVEAQKMKDQIVILGGTSFMGLQLLDKLLTIEGDFDIVLVNRGNSYWGGRSDELISKSKKTVHKVKTDRKKGKKYA